MFQEVRLGRDVYIAPTAYVAGDVTLGDQVTVMHHVVIRGDVAPIVVGDRCNIQDGSILHCNRGESLTIESDVGVGHGAIVHCARVGSNTLIGIRATVLDRSVIGKNCIIAAGSLLPPLSVIPDGKVVMGVPGKIVRDVTKHDLEYIAHVVASYLDLGRQHAAGKFPPVFSASPVASNSSRLSATEP